MLTYMPEELIVSILIAVILEYYQPMAMRIEWKGHAITGVEIVEFSRFSFNTGCQ